MRLYGTPASPFVARVRIQIVAKDLPVEIVEPPGGLESPQFRELSVLGRIPVLETDGALIPESAVIQEYLEDRFPTPSLRGCNALETARVRLVSRIVDLYLTPALQPLRVALRDPTRRIGLEQARVELDTVLGQLDATLSGGPYCVGDTLTLADCALAPVMLYADRLSTALLPGYSRRQWRRLESSITGMASHPAVAQVLALIESSLASRESQR